MTGRLGACTLKCRQINRGTSPESDPICCNHRRWLWTIHKSRESTVCEIGDSLNKYICTYDIYKAYVYSSLHIWSSKAQKLKAPPSDTSANPFCPQISSCKFTGMQAWLRSGWGPNLWVSWDLPPSFWDGKFSMVESWNHAEKFTYRGHQLSSGKRTSMTGCGNLLGQGHNTPGMTCDPEKPLIQRALQLSTQTIMLRAP